MDDPHFRNFVQQVSGDLEYLKGELGKVKEFIRYNEVSPSSPGAIGITRRPLYAQQPHTGSSFGSTLNQSFRQPNFDAMATGGTRRKRTKRTRTRKCKK